MPFTFAHPAAAIPLLRPLGRYGSLSALVIGSIAPDMAFIVPLALSREQTHGLGALLTFCLPFGALVYILFHALYKLPLIALLPACIGERLPSSALPFPATTSATLLAVFMSLLCGALTHLAWDAFTHPGTLVVMAIPWLQAPVVTLGGYHVYGYTLLQHAGTLIGLTLLASWIVKWMVRTPAAPSPGLPALPPGLRRISLPLIAGTAALIGLRAGLQRWPHVADLAGAREFTAGFIFAALPAFAFGLTCYSMLWHAARLLRR